MKLNKTVQIILIAVLLTAFLNWFFYVHESLPTPLRGITPFIGTPVAIASGLSYYFGLGISVYETFWVIILSNAVFSFCLVLALQQISKRRHRKNIKNCREK